MSAREPSPPAPLPEGEGSEEYRLLVLLGEAKTFAAAFCFASSSCPTAIVEKKGLSIDSGE